MLEPDGNVIFPEHNTTSFAATARLDASGNLQRSTSSKKYKKNICDLSEKYASSLDVVDQLRPVSFKDKTHETEHIGLIAEEVYKVIPELVTLHRGDPEGVEYPHMVALLVEAIKELKQQVSSLTAD